MFAFAEQKREKGCFDLLLNKHIIIWRIPKLNIISRGYSCSVERTTLQLIHKEIVQKDY